MSKSSKNKLHHSKKSDKATENVGTENEIKSDEKGASLKISRHYIKSISFKRLLNPSEPLPNKEQPKVAFHFEYAPGKLSDTDYELTLKLQAKCTLDKTDIYEADLSYGGVFILQDNSSTRGLQALLMVDCAHLLFPSAAFIFNTMIREGGFTPLTLGPINFLALYRESLERQRKEEKK